MFPAAPEMRRDRWLRGDPKSPNLPCTGSHLYTGCGSGGIAEGLSPGSSLSFVGGGSGGLGGAVYVPGGGPVTQTGDLITIPAPGYYLYLTSSFSSGSSWSRQNITVTENRKKRRGLNFVGNRPPGGPDDDEDPDDYEEYQRDLDKCRAMKGAAAADCYGAAERRRFARNNGKPLPPLARVAAGAAGGVAIGTILYWIISEGSRILFPVRNFVPVP